jgi:hypothetical protein
MSGFERKSLLGAWCLLQWSPNSSVAQSQVSFSAEDDKNSAIPEGYSSTAVGSAAAQSLTPRLVFPPSYPYPASPPRYAYPYPIPGVRRHRVTAR